MNPLQQIEQEVLAEGREWTRRRLEEQLQQQADAMPAVALGMYSVSNGRFAAPRSWKPQAERARTRTATKYLKRSSPGACFIPPR